MKENITMKTVKTILFSSIFIYIFIALTGCETESSDQIALQITPNTARVRVNESQEFVVTGFTDYTWSLSEASKGVLSTTKGDRTIYTAVAALDGSNSTQILKVEASAGGTTNSTTATIEALITHY